MGIRIGGLEIHWKPIRELLKGILARVGFRAVREITHDLKKEIYSTPFPYEFRGEHRTVQLPPDFIDWLHDQINMKTGRGFRLDKKEREAEALSQILLLVLDDAQEKNLAIDLDKVVRVAGSLPGLNESDIITQLRIVAESLRKGEVTSPFVVVDDGGSTGER